VGNVSVNVCAKFRCAPLRIKKVLGIFWTRENWFQQQEEQLEWLFGTRLPGPKLGQYEVMKSWILTAYFLCTAGHVYQWIEPSGGSTGGWGHGAGVACAPPKALNLPLLLDVTIIKSKMPSASGGGGQAPRNPPKVFVCQCCLMLLKQLTCQICNFILAWTFWEFCLIMYSVVRISVALWVNGVCQCIWNPK